MIKTLYETVQNMCAKEQMIVQRFTLQSRKLLTAGNALVLLSFLSNAVLQLIVYSATDMYFGFAETHKEFECSRRILTWSYVILRHKMPDIMNIIIPTWLASPIISLLALMALPLTFGPFPLPRSVTTLRSFVLLRNYTLSSWLPLMELLPSACIQCYFSLLLQISSQEALFLRYLWVPF